MKWIRFGVGALMMCDAVYCAVAFIAHWPLSNIVWFGAACGFLMSALERFGILARTDEQF